MSHLLVIREIQGKTAVRHQFMSVRTAMIQTLKITGVGRGVKTYSRVLRCWWESNGAAARKQCGGVPLKIKHGIAVWIKGSPTLAYAQRP